MRATELIKDANLVGPGRPFFLDRAVESQTIYVDFTGEATAISIALESCGNLEQGEDLANGIWHTMRTHPLSAVEIAAKQAAFSVVSTPVSVVRLNIVFLTGADPNTKINARYLPEA